MVVERVTAEASTSKTPRPQDEQDSGQPKYDDSESWNEIVLEFEETEL